jgi:hypothetical protein
MSPGLFLFGVCLRPPSSFRPFCHPFALRMRRADEPAALSHEKERLTVDWHSVLAFLLTFPCSIILSPL